MMKHNYWHAVLGLLTLVLLVAGTAPAEAQTKPFKIVGVGGGPDGIPLPGQPSREHWIVGVATHLGFHVGYGAVETESAFPEVDDEGNVTGFNGVFGSGQPFVFIGANGNRLVCDYGRDVNGGATGMFELNVLDVQITDDTSLPFYPVSFVVEAHWIADFVARPELSTGKFEGVTGSWVMDAYSSPFVLGSNEPLTYAWFGEGELTFQKRHGKK